MNLAGQLSSLRCRESLEANEPLKISPRNQNLPKYLRELAKDHALGKKLNTVFARAQASKLKTAAYKAAQMKYIDALEKGLGQDRIDKILKQVYYERTRYFANRIAQTETHRAVMEAKAKQYIEDDSLQFVEIRLSSSHPVVDICDDHAQVNKYGLGPGVYPKHLAPMPPFHPFCRCLVVPRDDIVKKSPVQEDLKADRKFMSKLSPEEGAKVLGSRAKYNEASKSSKIINTYDKNKKDRYKTMSIGTVVTGGLVAGKKLQNIKDRTPWHGSEAVVIATTNISSVQKDNQFYQGAKDGSREDAIKLVGSVFTEEYLAEIASSFTDGVVFIPVYAEEKVSVNRIPSAMTAFLAEFFEQKTHYGVIQSNKVGHTKSSGYHRISNPALFEGVINPGENYYIVDDFVGMGGTLASMKGFIESNGGNVVGFTTMLGQERSAILAVSQDTFDDLRRKHGQELEHWWIETFGYGLDRLSESEARYLLRSDSFDKIRAELTPGES